MNKQTQDLTLTCADGIPLAATLFSAESPKGAVMVAPATGILRRFYASFAAHLAEQGFTTITFDNRGIGDSGGGKALNQVDANLINWGRQDMPAVLRALQAAAPDTTYHLVGHSAGGQLLGLMENRAEIASMFNVASSSGSLKNMTYPFRFSAAFFLNVFIPFSNLLFGKTHSEWVGMGEPLPKKVAAQWSRWCNGSGYVATDFGKAIQEHGYDDLTLPSKWLHATDDGIANLPNVQEMIAVYANIAHEIVTLDPAELDYKDLGHMKFFSSKRKVLWKQATDWLHAHAVA
ncbi:MAG TPA: alpha/beta hydrolase [Cytophagales bacterium]|nr:alpha/beta hydrolase [Cytophagales bacterium]HAP59904.1 alpha/beta hydrolase [Cytophagales bacterium]